MWRSFEYYMGWPDTETGSYSGYIGILLIGSGAYLCVREVRELNGGVIRFGKAFYTGMVCSFIVCIMMGAQAYVYYKYVDPQRTERMVLIFHDQGKKENKSESEIKNVEDNARSFYSPLGQVQFDSGTTIISGLFVSLVVAAITSMKKNESSR